MSSTRVLPVQSRWDEMNARHRRLASGDNGSEQNRESSEDFYQNGEPCHQLMTQNEVIAHE